MNKYKVRTDLAMENGEKYEKDNVEIQGVTIKKHYNKVKDIHTTLVKIETEHGARLMEKPIGTYITMEAPSLAVADEDYHKEVSVELARHLKRLLPKNLTSVLVVGLGNQDVTPDALGPGVVGNLHITRHLIREYGSGGPGTEHAPMISSLVPGVMAQTGMETLEILQGVVEKTNPDIIVVIDALAARNTKRLNCTVQLTDTGISPGSGVGNYRCGLNKETLGIPVIGIGIPTVVDAGTIIHDAVSNLLEALEESEIEEFLGEIISPTMATMFVTPKDIDETIKRLSFTISEGINMAFTG
ncbi:GPR endopeptidase [Novisyntrophococcus fermenticellae]|uniref:GPR endopeptidase n=1 Tax=Novisyntrophococcus fermenticellae TaxID=2068655 RepID=UPI001E4C2F83|nr:GPR endopeptidase [Novisyntrophococcus fermenticellae]